MIDALVFAIPGNLASYAGDEAPGMGHVLLVERDPSPVGLFLLDLDGTVTRKELLPRITAQSGVDKETEARGDIADKPRILPAAELRQLPVLAADTGQSEIAHPSKNSVLT
jgi:hypothetical protein